jgi:hypothetical protein
MYHTMVWNGNNVESACILWIDIDVGNVAPAVEKNMAKRPPVCVDIDLQKTT